MKNKKLYSKIKKCRVSDDQNLIEIANFKKIGLTGYFPKKKHEKIIKTPLSIVFSKKSKLLQLNHNYKPDILYGENYGYRSGLNSSMVKHLKSKANFLKKKLKIKNSEKILDIGSNDGTFLNFFNCDTYGIDPSIIKYKKYYKSKKNLFPKTFEESFNQLNNSKFKLISMIAMFYDTEKPLIFLQNCEKILSKNGIIHIEVAYLPSLFEFFSYDTFCQEHYEYYTLLSLQYIVQQTKLKIVDIGFSKINGGSIWINLSKEQKESAKLKLLLKKEKKNGFANIRKYKNYFQKISTHSKKLNELIKKLKEKERISAIGASTKGNVLLQFSNLNSDFIDKIYDINSYKFNKYTPITKIPIFSEKLIKKDKNKYYLILIWHFKDHLLKKLKKLKKKMYLIFPFPKIKIFKIN